MPQLYTQEMMLDADPARPATTYRRDAPLARSAALVSIALYLGTLLLL